MVMNDVMVSDVKNFQQRSPKKCLLALKRRTQNEKETQPRKEKYYDDDGIKMPEIFTQFSLSHLLPSNNFFIISSRPLLLAAVYIEN